MVRVSLHASLACSKRSFALLRMTARPLQHLSVLSVLSVLYFTFTPGTPDHRSHATGAST
jgi:hypothetical protein